MKRFVVAWLCAIMMLALLAPAAAGPLEPEQELGVGSQLVAVRDVQLRDATVAKGSRVKVVSVRDQDGKPAAFDLELADGHVVRGVSSRKVRSDFRPAS
jgi:hypothetical protein